jgi:hypothetical protein
MTVRNFMHRVPTVLFSSLSVIIPFFLLPASAQSQQPDSLGTVKAEAIGCPSGGLSATACYALDVTCPGIPDYTVYLKTIAPTVSPVGVVTLTTGGTSTELFEQTTYGSVTVQNLVDARFLTVEVSFGGPFNDSENGWQTNVGGAGVRAASCRYATMTEWIKNNLAPRIPLCAAGISAGSQQIAEGLAHYGLGQYLAFAELASGPPFNRTDEACIRGQSQFVEYCSGKVAGMLVALGNAQDYIDPAYPGPWCSQDIKTGGNLHQAKFLSDSVTSPDALLSYPATSVWFLYGGLDDSLAINQGENYRLNIRTPNHSGCVTNAPHSIPDVLSGAQQMASDLSLQCTFPKQHEPSSP